MSKKLDASPRLLYLDRPGASTDELARRLERAGLRVRRCESTEEAAAQLAAAEFDLVLGPISLAGGELLDRVERDPDAPGVLLLEEFGSESDTVAALARGALDAIPSPASADKVLMALRRALARRQLEAENRRLRSEVRERFELGNLVTRDQRMQAIFQTIDTVADSRASLLIQGESGTGKTVLARAVHERSGRKDAPFVVVNCGALPATLLESELFGYVRGAFTGAVRDRTGKFEAADGGTIFLDEISTASLDLQVKLLRVIEEGRLERVGDTKTREVDVRLIAASNRDLPEEVAAKRFREDLFYRINVVSVRIPPLRERTEDVPLLAERFLSRMAAEHERDVRGIAPDAMSALCAHDWPGNVRELENTIERAVLLTRGERLRRADLWPAEPGVAFPEEDASTDREAPWGELPLGPLREVLAVPERWIILRALRHHGGNRQETARTLGINRTTLFNKMRKYQLLDLPPKMEKERDSGPDLREAG